MASDEEVEESFAGKLTYHGVFVFSEHPEASGTRWDHVVRSPKQRKILNYLYRFWQ